jgi:hypothetical protein
VDQLPDKAVVDEIAQKVDVAAMEKALMDEGVKKFADPQKALEKSIGERRGKAAGCALNWFGIKPVRPDDAAARPPRDPSPRLPSTTSPLPTARGPGRQRTHRRSRQ